jgi:hypothetical protein
MKTNFFLFAALITITLGLSACYREDIGPYQPETVTLNLTDFRKVDLGSAFRVRIIQGNSYAVIIRGDRRNLDDLETFVSGNTLKSYYRNNRNRQYETEFIITMPQLTAVDFSGAVHADVTGFNTTGLFKAVLSGASRAAIQVSAEGYEVELSGASDLDLTGSAYTMLAEVSGASLLRAFNCPVAEAEVNVSGASTARLKVTAKLTGVASGASQVRYRGNPTMVNVSTSGSSSVSQD